MDTLLKAVDVVIVAFSALLVSQIATRPRRLASDYALMLFFAAVIAMNLPYMVWQNFSPALPAWYSVVSHLCWIVAPLLCGPALWIYVRTLTAEKPLPWRRGHFWHLLPFFAGCLLMLPYILLGPESRERIIEDVFPLTTHEALAATLMTLLEIAFFVSVGSYVPAILLRIRRYQRHLRDVFASTEGREMVWLFGIGTALYGYWLSRLFDLIAELAGWTAHVPDWFVAAIDLAVIWVLSVWGLRQRPGYEGIDLEEVPEPPLTPQSINLSEPLEEDTAGESEDAREQSNMEPPKPPRETRNKYEKSALTQERAARIAAKIETAMKEKGLYRNDMLSLSILAREVRESSNYVSQALNETLGQSFFEYVNGWRIREAQHALRTTDDTVLTVAMNMGFNSRSSFYKAFRMIVGVTPTEYRKREGVGH